MHPSWLRLDDDNNDQPTSAHLRARTLVHSFFLSFSLRAEFVLFDFKCVFLVLKARTYICVYMCSVVVLPASAKSINIVTSISIICADDVLVLARQPESSARSGNSTSQPYWGTQNRSIRAIFPSRSRCLSLSRSSTSTTFPIGSTAKTTTSRK